MGLIRGTANALILELLLVVIIVSFCVGSGLRRQAFDAGYAACKLEMADRAQLAYSQGKEAGALDTAQGAYEAGRMQGAIDMLTIYEHDGPAAMVAQVKVIRGTR